METAPSSPTTKQLYREIVGFVHPDRRNPANKELSNSNFAAITELYDKDSEGTNAELYTLFHSISLELPPKGTELNPEEERVVLERIKDKLPKSVGLLSETAKAIDVKTDALLQKFRELAVLTKGSNSEKAMEVLIKPFQQLQKFNSDGRLTETNQTHLLKTIGLGAPAVEKTIRKIKDQAADVDNICAALIKQFLNKLVVCTKGNSNPEVIAMHTSLVAFFTLFERMMGAEPSATASRPEAARTHERASDYCVYAITINGKKQFYKVPKGSQMSYDNGVVSFSKNGRPVRPQIITEQATAKYQKAQKIYSFSYSSRGSHTNVSINPSRSNAGKNVRQETGSPDVIKNDTRTIDVGRVNKINIIKNSTVTFEGSGAVEFDTVKNSTLNIPDGVVIKIGTVKNSTLNSGGVVITNTVKNVIANLGANSKFVANVIKDSTINKSPGAIFLCQNRRDTIVN